MSQQASSEDPNRAQYSPWNRTPGKPNSSFLNTKMSNISSSSDSGVGRTPTWQSDSDCKFPCSSSSLEGNPWAAVPQSPECPDSAKQPPWEDLREDGGTKASHSNSLTFGFSSQWSLGNSSLPLSANHNNNNNSCSTNNSNSNHSNHSNNPTWGLPASSPGDYTLSLGETSSKLLLDNNCWNLPSCQADEGCYLPRASSIWSSGAQQRPFSDSHDIEHSTITTSSMSTTNIIDLTATVASKLSLGEGGEEGDCQTWAQAVGKAVCASVNSSSGGEEAEGALRREVDERYESIINRVDGWGSHTVDQSTPWIIDDVDVAAVNLVCSPSELTMSSSQRSRSSTSTAAAAAAESNVWTNEPPNGVGVWESHYEMIGEKTSRWASAAVGGVVKPKSGWGEVPESAVAAAVAVSSQWGERDCDSSVWSAGTSIVPEVRAKVAWMGGVPPGGKQESLVGAIGSGSRVAAAAANYPLQRNNNSSVLSSSIGVASLSGDLNEPLSRQPFYQPQNINNMLTNNNRSNNPNVKVRPMMNLGFRKEDAQPSVALFNNTNSSNSNSGGGGTMDMNRAMNNHNSVNNSLSTAAQRHDWQMMAAAAGVDNFHGGGPSVEQQQLDSYLQQPSLKQQQHHQQQQQMQMHLQQQQQQQQQMAAVNNSRLVSSSSSSVISENQLLFEKQIMKEINQLQAKQQELVHRIGGLRSIVGSQAIAQEMQRTLNEVRQQLNTQQTTLKVIRGQMTMPQPNGMNMAATRSMQVGNLVSGDLSQHMNDMKLQKRNLELWPQGGGGGGSLASPSTMSPYMNIDKSSGMYYNNPGGGGGAPGQQVNGPFSYSKQQQSNYLHHRQSAGAATGGQMWPSRAMQQSQSLAPGLSSLSTVNNSADSHEDGDPASSGGGDLQQSRQHSTTALSLSSQTLSSSAFTSRDISFASANISEFVPGQPWPGISYSQRDDPNATLGTGQRSLLSVTNDHLEKLANSNVNSLITSNDNVGANHINMNRLSGGRINGINSTASVTYVLIRDLPSHINIEMLRNTLTSSNFPGLIQMHPNLAARWVLLHFNCNEETLKAFKNLCGKVGVVELVPDQEVSQRLQYQNSGNCSVGPVIAPQPPCSNLMDFHHHNNNNNNSITNHHNQQQQQQQQSHYLH